MSVVPGRGVFWCMGQCGVDERCPDSTYNAGYCLDPKSRKTSTAPCIVKPTVMKIHDTTVTSQ